MNIDKMIIYPEGSDIGRVYEWVEKPLLVEELLSFVTIIGKKPEKESWIEE